jgi:hypothetical protein
MDYTPQLAASTEHNQPAVGGAICTGAMVGDQIDIQQATPDERPAAGKAEEADQDALAVR